MTNIYKIPTKNWQHKLNSIGEVVTELEDIEQCYKVIFKTRKGSVVLNPNLGWNFLDYLDVPLNLVEAKMRIALLKELNYQEPRAKAIDAKFSYTDAKSGKLSVKITYQYQTETTGAIATNQVFIS